MSAYAVQFCCKRCRRDFCDLERTKENRLICWACEALVEARDVK